MNLLSKSACAVMMLGLVAGCTDDESANPPSSNPATNVPPATSRPIVPPAGSIESAKGEAASKVMTPPPGPAEATKAGEAKKGDDSPKLEGPKSDAGKGDSAAAKLSTDEINSIKELPAAEQAAAIKQAVCPVSGHNLGEMGKPVKVSAEGRTFYLCCEDCQGKVKTDAKGVIAKLDAQAKK